MNYNEFVAKNIEREIAHSGKSKTQVAKELGVAPETVMGYTSGKSFPGVKNIRKLCVILDCAYEEILGKLEN